jgi:hypothetical protein
VREAKFLWPSFMEGDIGETVQSLRTHDESERLAREEIAVVRLLRSRAAESSGRGMAR